MNELHKPDAAFASLFLPQKMRSGVCYVPSQFALRFTHGGREYAFHLMTKQCLETALPEEAFAGGGFDRLIEAMFLVPEDRDECAWYQSVIQMMRLYAQKDGVSLYTIMPTLGCNARCTYCYEEGREQVTMTADIAEQTLRYILETHGGRQVSLSWFGGEPLLCPETIDRICAGLKEAGVPYRSGIVTNGSLITPTVLEKMKGLWHVRRVQISMDGAEHDYRERKRYYVSEGQYRAVMENICRLSEAGITVSVRCNVDEGNLDGIPQFLDDLDSIVRNKKNVVVYLSPLMHVREGENDLAFWKKTAALQPEIEKAGFRPLNYMGPRRKLHVNKCMADGGGVVISPDGSLYPCEHCPPESRYGDVFHGVTDEKAKREFCRTDSVREKCRHCPYLPECTGFASCPWHDTHCREVRELLTLVALRLMIDGRDEAGMQDEEEMNC